MYLYCGGFGTLTRPLIRDHHHNMNAKIILLLTLLAFSTHYLTMKSGFVLNVRDLTVYSIAGKLICTTH